MKLYDRGQLVHVKVGTVLVPMHVVFDTGGKVVVSRYHKPGDTERVKRSDIQVPRPKKLACVKTERGVCATQRQAVPPKKMEVAEGVITMCGLWVQSTTGTYRAEPTCERCLKATVGIRRPKNGAKANG
jgi:hypothetical protein